MNVARHRWLVALFALLAALFILTTLLLGYLSRGTELPSILGNWPEHLLRLPAVVSTVLLGLLIFYYRPHNRYGWLWLCFGLTYVLTQLGKAYSGFALLARPGAYPFGAEMAWVADRAWLVFITLTPFTLLLFPNSRLPSRRWRWVAWLIIGAFLITFAASSFTPWPEGTGVVPFDNPFAFLHGPVGSYLAEVWSAPTMFTILTIIPAALSVFGRFRQAQGVERAQLKWFSLGASFIGLFMLLNIIYGVLVVNNIYLFDPPQLFWDLAFQLSYSALVAGIGMAILRHQLYDVDVVIRRTLIYSLLTALLIVVYMVDVVVMQNVLMEVTDSRQSQLATVISTMVVAIAFNPLRTWAQAFVDRRFYRRKYNAQQTLLAFGNTIRHEVKLDSLLEQLMGAIEETMQPQSLSLWMRTPRISDYSRSDPTPYG